MCSFPFFHFSQGCREREANGRHRINEFENNYRVLSLYILEEFIVQYHYGRDNMMINLEGEYFVVYEKFEKDLNYECKMKLK